MTPASFVWNASFCQTRDDGVRWTTKYSPATLCAFWAYIRILNPLPPVYGNEAGLTQCISNLFTNAVKFVKTGVRPELQIWTETKDQVVRICVKDNGIGISSEHLESIFSIFQRVSKTYEGTGIGPAIVKKCAERMGGRVGVKSELGQGSTFWFEVNAIKSDPIPSK